MMAEDALMFRSTVEVRAGRDNYFRLAFSKDKFYIALRACCFFLFIKTFILFKDALIFSNSDFKVSFKSTSESSISSAREIFDRT